MLVWACLALPPSRRYQLVATISVAWSWRTDLNPRPDAYKTSALPTELHQHIWSARSTLRKVSWPKTGTVPAAPSLQMATHFDIGNDLTRLEDSIRFELMMLVKHTGFQDLRNKPNSANYPFLLIHEIGKLICQFEIYVSFTDIFHEFYTLQTDTAYSM